MLIDFHSHLESPNSILCTDEPLDTSCDKVLMEAQGLLPERWNAERQQKLIENLTANPKLQIGEVGLDKRFLDVVPIGVQISSLTEMLEVAKHLKRSISLHCVQETGPMVEILRKARLPRNSVLWHGFTGSAETAKVLHSLGVIISVGPRFRGSLKDLSKANPDFVLETDYTGNDVLEHDLILEKLYLKCSSELDIPVSGLEEHCERLFSHFSAAF